MKEFPIINNEDDVSFAVQEIVRLRNTEDVAEIANLPNVFIRGRKVGKVPSGSSDVAATDAAGDFNYDASYIYILIDNSGTPVWRRATLGSW